MHRRCSRQRRPQTSRAPSWRWSGGCAAARCRRSGGSRSAPRTGQCRCLPRRSLAQRVARRGPQCSQARKALPQQTVDRKRNTSCNQEGSLGMVGVVATSTNSQGTLLVVAWHCPRVAAVHAGGRERLMMLVSRFDYGSTSRSCSHMYCTLEIVCNFRLTKETRQRSGGFVRCCSQEHARHGHSAFRAGRRLGRRSHRAAGLHKGARHDPPPHAAGAGGGCGPASASSRCARCPPVSHLA